MTNDPDEFPELETSTQTEDMERVKSLLAHLDKSKRLQEEQLRKICRDDPDFRMLVLLIGDAFENALFYLCNFETAININGGETPMVDVSEGVRRHFEKHFKDVTGVKYLPEVARNQNRKG